MLSDWLIACKPRLAKAGFNKFLKLVEEGKVPMTPKHVIDAIYHDLRSCSYPFSARNAANIDVMTSQAARGMEVRAENGWHYRLPTNRRAMGWSSGGETVGRVSLNVYAEPELVEKLDEFCVLHKAYYKTPNQIAVWEERHDPITIYFHEPISADIQAKLRRIVTPHVRGNNLHGHKIADGICMEASPSIQDINTLIARAEQLNPELGVHVRKLAHQIDPLKPMVDIEPKLSSGQKRAVEIALDDYEQYAAKTATSAVPQLAPANIFAEFDCTVSSYNGTSGKMLSMVIQGTPEQLADAAKNLERLGLKSGEAFSNRTGKQIVVMGAAAQQAIADVCHARGINPSSLHGKPAGS